MTRFQHLKLAIVAYTGLSKDALHIYVGMSVLFVSALVFRRLRYSVVPWLAVLVVAVLLEMGDLRDNLMILGHWDWASSLHDIVNTLFWPTVLWLAARRRWLGAGLQR